MLWRNQIQSIRLILLVMIGMLLSQSMAFAQKRRIKVAPNSPTYKEGLEIVRDRYEALHPDVEVELIFVSRNYETWIRTQFSAGENMAPDIYAGQYTGSYGRLGKWAALDQHLTEVNPYTGQPWQDTFEMEIINKSKEGGAIYSIPLDFIEIGVFYNQDLFEQHGYQVPTTWTEMITLCQQIQQDDLIPFAIPGNLDSIWESHIGWMVRILGDIYYRRYVPLLMAQPGDWDFIPERNANFVPDLGSPYDDMMVDINKERLVLAVKDGLIRFDDAINRQIYDKLKEWSGFWQEGFLGSDFGMAHRLFLLQEAVMEIGTSSLVSFLGKEMNDLKEEDRFGWGVFWFPRVEGQPPMRGCGGMGTSFVVTKKSDPQQTQSSIDFLKFMTTPESVQTIINAALDNERPITGPPTVKGVELPPELSDTYRAFLGHGFEKINFRGLDDEQESAYEWSVLVQEYLGDRISLDAFLEGYQALMERAVPRVARQRNMDLDPTTPDRSAPAVTKVDWNTAAGFLHNSTAVVCLLLLLWVTVLALVLWRQPSGAIRKRSLIAYGLLSPTFLLIVLFMYYPALYGLLSAFTEWEEGTQPFFNGLENFRKMTGDPFLRAGVVNLIILTVSGLLKATLVPFLVAELILYLRSKRLQYFFRTSFLVPMVVPAMVVLLIWHLMYEPHIGILNNLLTLIGLDDYRQTWLGEPHLALPSIIMVGFPWVGALGFLIYLAGLMNIPSSTLDAARIDCQNTLQRIWYIDVHLVKGQTRLLIVLAMIGSLQDFQSILILTQGGPGTSTMIPALRMFHSAFRFDHFGYGAAIGFVLFVVIVLMTIINYFVFKPEEES